MRIFFCISLWKNISRTLPVRCGPVPESGFSRPRTGRLPHPCALCKGGSEETPQGYTTLNGTLYLERCRALSGVPRLPTPSQAWATPKLEHSAPPER